VTVRLFNASIDGLIETLRVDDQRMTFTFLDSWLSCGRVFHFDLQRP
jgi:hypothetical protein